MKKTILIILCCLAAFALCGCAASEPASDCTFAVVNDSDRGTVVTDAEGAVFPAGTELTVHAVPAEDSSFLCWSVGGLYADGGASVSYQKDYTFTIEEDTTLYANFRGHDSVYILYHANGGTSPKNVEVTGDPAKDYFYTDEFSLAYYLYPNALPDMGYFERDGYNLIGYNTEADNSGRFYAAGAKIFEDTDQVIELYCVWSRETDADYLEFTWNAAYDGLTVTGYTGRGPTVSIPAEHDGKPVVAVASGALAGNKRIENIVFPSSIRVIEDGSCSDCENLSVLILFDSLDYISDAAFENDENLYTVYIGAATAPVYCNYFNNHSKKIEIMNYWKDSERPLMIMLGGSSLSYAVHAQLLEESLDEDYVVLNCGMNGAVLFTMASEWAMRFMDEGDFLLQDIEYSYWQLGGVTVTAYELFRSFESCYNVFSWIRLGKFYDFFDYFNEYLTVRKSLTPVTYEDYVNSIAPNGFYDEQGTLQVSVRANGSDAFWKNRRIYLYGYTDMYDDRSGFLYDHMIFWSNLQYEKLDDLGVRYAMTFAPLNRNALYSTQTEAGIEAFESYLIENLNTPVISHVRDAILPPAIFFDDDYHLSAEARTDYTLRLADDLNAFFASDGADES